MSKKGCLITIVVIIIIFILLAACAAICWLIGSALSDYDLSSSSEAQSVIERSGGDDKIAVIPVEGVIMDAEVSSSILGSTIASSQLINKYLDYAIDDKDVKAVILVINSPGGDVYASDEIYKKIVEVKQSGIKVITLMKGTAASGGYYIAAPSDKIVASPLTITGSIGVLVQVQSLDGLYEKLGIDVRTITNSEGDYKTGEGLFDDDPDGVEDKIMEKIVDEAFDRFVSIVSEGRDIEKKELMKVADGRIFTGKQAVKYDLVDVLGGFEEALQLANEEAGISNPTIIKYKELGFLDLLMGYAANIVNPSARVLEAIDIAPGVRLQYLYVEK